MTDVPDQQSAVTLWILKWQHGLSNALGMPLVASALLFAVPLALIAGLVQWRTGFRVFTPGVVAALLWLALAPNLIQRAFLLVDGFFKSHRGLFATEDGWRSVRQRELERLQSSRYLVFGIPWALAITAVIEVIYYRGAPLIVKVWSTGTFLLLFLLSAIGFYGVYVLVTMMRNVCCAGLSFNPYHPDKFGGFSDFGRFSVKGALLFSTGALVFPLAFEVVTKLGQTSLTLTGLVYALIGCFILVPVVSFIAPVMEIKKFVDREKERIILESWARLNAMTTEFRNSPDLNIKKALEIIMHYYLNHMKLLEVKNYPWDFKVFVELGASFLLPIGAAVLQIIIQRRLQ